jgi:hypothetical protein
LICFAQHLRPRAIAAAPVCDDFDAIPADQQDADAGRMRTIDFPLAFDDAGIALRENLFGGAVIIGTPRSIPDAPRPAGTRARRETN